MHRAFAMNYVFTLKNKVRLILPDSKFGAISRKTNWRCIFGG